VKKEMLEKGISETAIEKVQPLFNFTGTINEKIEKLSQFISEFRRRNERRKRVAIYL
jgi:histidyl-tRNA synthetase